MLYILIVLLANSNDFIGDEGRYVMYAKNLLKGYFSSKDTVYLWSGPGYPIILMPFVKLKLPWIAAKFLNPIFLFAAVLYFYNTLRLYMNEHTAMIFSYLLGLYPPFCRYIHQLVTEQLAIFLVCGFIYHFCKLCRNEKFHWAHCLISSVYLGYLALTKVLFGYVIMIGLLMFILLYLWKKKDEYKKTALVYLLAFLVCIPYLVYTYSITDKIFYWGSQGGLFLYLMSSPHASEYGDWFERNSKNHYAMYNEIAGLSAVERDYQFKKKAVQNIMRYPQKYIKNVMSNIGRLIFNYPFSYDTQRLSTYFYIIPNMFLLVFSVLCLYPMYLRRNLIPFEIYALILFALISFGGLSIVSSENRYSWPLVPIIMFWSAFTFTRFVKIGFRS